MNESLCKTLRAAIILILILGLSGWMLFPRNALLLAQPAASKSRAKKLPTFADFPVQEIFKGTPAPVNTRSHRLAREFRVTLDDGARNGPNFAGHRQGRTG